MHGYKWPNNSPRTRTDLMALLLEAGGDDEWIVMNSSFRSRIRFQMVGSSDVAPFLTAHVVDPTAAAARHIQWHGLYYSHRSRGAGAVPYVPTSQPSLGGVAEPWRLR